VQQPVTVDVKKGRNSFRPFLSAPDVVLLPVAAGWRLKYQGCICRISAVNLFPAWSG
jgi:hypothetical protein